MPGKPIYFRSVENTELLAKETFIAVPEAVFNTGRMNAARSVAVAVRLLVRIDQVPAIKANGQLLKHSTSNFCFL